MSTNNPQAQTGLTRVISIQVPSTLKWQPQVAQQLLVSWFSLSEPLSLIIRATANSIEWQVETSRQQEAALKQTLYGFYPRAQVKVSSKPSPAIGFRLYHFKANSSFIAPLLTVQEFLQLDPLSGVVSALGTLQKNESLIYELQLYPAREKYYELGEQLLKALMAQAEADKKTQELPRYGPKQQQLAIAKLDAPLKEVEFAIKIKASTKERSKELIRLLKPALAVYESEGFNQLVPAYEPSLGLVLTASEVAALWHLPSEQCKNPRIKWAGGAHTPLPAEVANLEEGLLLGKNKYQGETQDVYLPDKDRKTHTSIIGRTEMGKSTLLHHLIHQDIAAGRGVGVIDPHGDLVDSILQTSIPPDREEQVCLLDLTDKEFPVGLNVLYGQPESAPDEVAGQILTLIKKRFAESSSDKRLDMGMYAALRSMVEYPEATIQDIPRLFFNPAFRATVLANVSDPSTLSYWYDQYDLASESMQRTLAEPIITRVNNFYRHETTRRIMAQKQSLNFRKIMDDGIIFLAKLSGVPESEADVLGALLFSKFQLAATSRINIPKDERIPYFLYVDEVQKFVTTSLPEIFSEVRKFGLHLTVANQFLGQLKGETLEAILGNVGTSITFRVGSKDASALAPFMSPIYSAQDLAQLSQFHAAIKMQIAGNAQPPFSIETMNPLSMPDDAKERVDRIKRGSRERFARPRDEVDAELLERYQHLNVTQKQESDETKFYD